MPDKTKPKATPPAEPTKALKIDQERLLQAIPLDLRD
jgi:hypothetical protein